MQLPQRDSMKPGFFQPFCFYNVQSSRSAEILFTFPLAFDEGIQAAGYSQVPHKSLPKGKFHVN